MTKSLLSISPGIHGKQQGVGIDHEADEIERGKNDDDQNNAEGSHILCQLLVVGTLGLPSSFTLVVFPNYPHSLASLVVGPGL